jgi:Terminase small subunit
MSRKPRKPRESLSTAEEAFAQAYVLNANNGADAVATAWPHACKWKPQSRAERASKLLALAKVQARVLELAKIAKEKANAEFAMSAEEIIWRLTLMARANLKGFMELDADGQPTIAFKDADEAKLYAVCEITVEDIASGARQGKRTRIKLPDRIAALKLLGTHHGMFATDVKLNGGLPIPVVLSTAEAAL